MISFAPDVEINSTVFESAYNMIMEIFRSVLKMMANTKIMGVPILYFWIALTVFLTIITVTISVVHTTAGGSIGEVDRSRDEAERNRKREVERQKRKAEYDAERKKRQAEYARSKRR